MNAAVATSSRVTIDGPKAQAKGKGKEREHPAGAGANGLFGLAGKHVQYGPLSYHEIVTALCEFLEVALHTILCVRGVYPPEVFARKKRYGVPVYQSRHPGLSAYIGEAVRAAKAQILRENVRAVVLLITRASDARTPLERFVFRFDHLLPVPPVRDRALDIQGAPTLPELELALRAMVQRLVELERTLAPYAAAADEDHDDEDVTCAIVVECKEGRQPQSDDPNEPAQGPWVPAAAELAPTDPPQGRDASAGPAAYTLPIKALETGVINLLFYAQEHVANKGTPSGAGGRAGGSSAAARAGAGAAAGDEAQQRRVLAAATQRTSAASRTAPVYRDAERDIDQHSKVPVLSDGGSSDGGGGGGGGKGRKSKRASKGKGKERAKGTKRRRKGAASARGSDGDRSRAYGAAMGVRSGGGVQNGADIGDTDESESDSESEGGPGSARQGSEDSSDSRSESSRGTDGADGGAAGSDNDMTSVAGIGFGGPAKAGARRGW